MKEIDDLVERETRIRAEHKWHELADAPCSACVLIRIIDELREDIDESERSWTHPTVKMS